MSTGYAAYLDSVDQMFEQRLLRSRILLGLAFVVLGALLAVGAVSAKPPPWEVVRNAALIGAALGAMMALVPAFSNELRANILHSIGHDDAMQRRIGSLEQALHDVLLAKRIGPDSPGGVVVVSLSFEGTDAKGHPLASLSFFHGKAIELDPEDLARLYLCAFPSGRWAADGGVWADISVRNLPPVSAHDRLRMMAEQRCAPATPTGPTTPKISHQHAPSTPRFKGHP